VASIGECSRRRFSQLDGIPIAIELRRVPVLTVDRTAARPGDRMHPVTGGSRIPRGGKQTLRGAIDGSYDLFNEQERKFLNRQSMFPGRWPR
jgi:predicted ATPase